MEQVVGKEITDTMHRFAQQFNALGLSHREKALLCSIQLTTIPQSKLWGNSNILSKQITY